MGSIPTTKNQKQTKKNQEKKGNLIIGGQSYFLQ
jgi:hypothetical protein